VYQKVNTIIDTLQNIFSNFVIRKISRIFAVSKGTVFDTLLNSLCG